MIPLPPSRRVSLFHWKSLTLWQASTLACGGLLYYVDQCEKRHPICEGTIPWAGGHGL